jgi:hypothetical protein
VFDIAAFGCAGATVIHSSPTLTGVTGKIYDANFGSVGGAAYYYVIYQGSPQGAGTEAMMTLASVTPTQGSSYSASLPGSTRPGFSNLETYRSAPQTSPLSVVSIVQTDTPQLRFGVIGNGAVSFQNPVTVHGGTNEPIQQIARADFNGDKWTDFALSQYADSSQGATVACSSADGALGCTTPATAAGGTGDLLAAGDPAHVLPQLIRVQRSASAISQGAAVSLAGFSGSPGMVTQGSPAYHLPKGYMPIYVGSVVSTHQSASALIIVTVATQPGSSRATAFAHQVDEAGNLIAQTQMDLAGVPTAMTLGNYPCPGKQQLVVAYPTTLSPVIVAYELPAF